MTPLSESHTGAAIAFYGLIAVFALLEQRTRIESLRHRTGTRRDAGSFNVLVGSIGAGIAGAFVLASQVPATAIDLGRWALFGCGLGAIVAGLTLRQWAIAQLGALFTVDVRVQEHQAVVDTGPYRWVRHPSYSGLVLVLLGIGLCLGSWTALMCVLVVPLAGLTWRIRVEERVLCSALGEPYERFMATRARLIPHVW